MSKFHVDKNNQSYREEDKVLSSRYGNIVCTICHPVTEIGVDKALITLHGWGGTRCGPHRMFVSLCRQAAQQGGVSIRFDLPGRGNSDGEDVSLDEMIGSVLDVSAYVREQWRIEDIALCGICAGGNVAIGAATVGNFCRLALISTFGFVPSTPVAAHKNLYAKLKEYGRKALSFQMWRRLMKGDINFRGVGKVLQDSAKESTARDPLKDSARDIMRDFQKYSGKALFVYAEADPQAQDAMGYYQQFCESFDIDAAFSVIDGANHNFMATYLSEELERRVVDFIA